MKTSKWKAYAFWILLSVAVGALSGWLTREGTRLFSETAAQPPLSPPMWVFPVVWGGLYLLMGISGARVSLTPQSEDRSRGLNLFVLQLVVNFFWSLIFFNAQAYGFAVLWLDMEHTAIDVEAVLNTLARKFGGEWKMLLRFILRSPPNRFRPRPRNRDRRSGRTYAPFPRRR